MKEIWNMEAEKKWTHNLHHLTPIATIESFAVQPFGLLDPVFKRI